MDFEPILTSPIIRILFTLVVALGLHQISDAVVAAIVHRALKMRRSDTITNSKRKDTLVNIFSAATRLVIWFAAASVVLGILSINIATIATGAGFVGIIIGIGAQATIRDYIAGISILIENQYRVGDVITLSGGPTGTGTSGLVEEITLRITKLRDLDGTLNIIRNGEPSVITNRTYGYSSIVLDIGVAYDSDIDQVEKIMNDVGKAMQKDKDFEALINQPITFLRVDQFTATAIMVRAVGNVKPAAQWEVAGEYRRQLLKAFKKADIAITMPA